MPRHTPFERSAEQVISELWLVADLVWAGILLPEVLPTIATDFLVRGADTPALRNLAGFDLQPFDPRDAVDLFAEVLVETHMPTLAADLRLERGAHVLAAAWSEGHICTAAMLKRFYRLAVAMEYPEHDEVMRLYSLDDEWKAGWGRPNAQIEEEVSEIMAVISTGRITPPEGLLVAIAQAT